MLQIFLPVLQLQMQHSRCKFADLRLQAYTFLRQNTVANCGPRVKAETAYDIPTAHERSDEASARLSWALCDEGL